MMKLKTENKLKSTIWYHGTILSNWKNICEKGILCNYNLERSNELDFGYGFYLTTDEKSAEGYISKLIESGIFNKNEKQLILAFELCPYDCFISKEYKLKVFEEFNDDFAMFVFQNRTENMAGSKQHSYDIIYGVMSDSVPTILIQQYLNGEASMEYVMEGLKKRTSMKQLSLHNQKLCDIMQLKKAYTVDRQTGERKELDINEYNYKF